LALLKNCEIVVALLHYNYQAAAAVDYIMFNFDNFSISNFIWIGFIKENSHVWRNKRNKYSINRIDWEPNHSLIQKEKSLRRTGRVKVEVGSQTFRGRR
jgi:hypothetical protein